LSVNKDMRHDALRIIYSSQPIACCDSIGLVGMFG
jgi:hypothetical protein